ncbi:MAG TPA: hypothetical protein VG297_22995 [Bryobacteraceae bacterium]|nr:hypothetical protein [Bryobacteraceae bacterium]
MKLGAEPKKIAILGGLLTTAAVVLYFNVFSGPSEPTPQSRPARVAAPSTDRLADPVAPSDTTASTPASAPRTERKRAAKGGGGSEFKIRQGTPPGEDKPDPATIDPTLRLDLLAKVQAVEAPESMRNIFQYGAAPPPPSAKPIDLPKAPPKIAINNQPPPTPTGPPPSPPPPVAPPMTFKYYGYELSKSNGRKQAFLLDGDDIIIAAENEPMKRGRYRIVRIGVNSIVIEDTQFKSTQTLPLVEVPAAAA